MQEHLACVSRPQAVVLALWSFGVAVTGCCGLTSVSVLLGEVLGRNWATMRQRLREWYWDAAHKKGHRRAELDVTCCFVPLLRWVLTLWPVGDKRVALAIDATSLSDRFTVLSISLLYQRCAIPVAWWVVGAQDKGSWKPQWLRLLALMHDGIPSDCLVLVAADRGLYADWLFRAIVEHGWHPFLRVNGDGKYRRLHGRLERRLSAAAPQPGSHWSGRVVCFKSRPLRCTLLADWGVGYAEPCLVLTDLLPQDADGRWYALRSWIEDGFKDLKRGGLQWQRTRITDPTRAQRMWLVLAVATLRLISIGAAVEPLASEADPRSLPATNAPPKQPPLSRFRHGQLRLLGTLIRQIILPEMPLSPYTWPAFDTS